MATGEQIVEVLGEEWQAIVALGTELGEEEWGLASECPGWSVRDLVSHMVGTERSFLGEPAPAGPAPAAHVRNEVGATNERWVAERRARPGAEVLAEFAAVTARRLDELRSFAPARFDEIGPSPMGMVPYREFMAVRVMDCWVHEQDMRVATGRPRRIEGPAAAVALDRIASAMPFVVGKRAAAPEGASVRFDVEGPLGRQIDISVRDGRAGVVEALDGPPAATVSLGSDAFWRLGCGRVRGAEARAEGLVTFAGDDALAERVAGSMAFMI